MIFKPIKALLSKFFIKNFRSPYVSTSAEADFFRSGLKTKLPILSAVFDHSNGPVKWKKTLQEEDYGEDLSKFPLEFRQNMLNYALIVVKAQDKRVQEICKKKKFKSWGVIQLLIEI